MPRSKQAVLEERAEVASEPDPGVLQGICDVAWVVFFQGEPYDRGFVDGNYSVIVKGSDLKHEPTGDETVVKNCSREVARHIAATHKFAQLHFDDVHCDVVEEQDSEEVLTRAPE